MKSLPAYEVRIYLAGDYDEALCVARAFCYREGMCFTVTKTKFVYTGGEEDGIIVGLVNYPRFPTTEDRVMSVALRMVEDLLPRLNQRTALVSDGRQVSWIEKEAPGRLTR